MKQQLKIMIEKNEKIKSVWITLPTKQADFENLIKSQDFQFEECKILKVCCNSYALSQAIMKSKITSKTLSQINYLGELFSHFNKSQRTLFGSICDLYLPGNSLDEFLNLAMNVSKNTPNYVNFIVQVPTKFKIKIRRKNDTENMA